MKKGKMFWMTLMVIAVSVFAVLLSDAWDQQRIEREIEHADAMQAWAAAQYEKARQDERP